MKKMLLIALFTSMSALANQVNSDYLIQVSPETNKSTLKLMSLFPMGSKVQDLGVNNWVRVQIPESKMSEFKLHSLKSDSRVLKVQPNYKIKLLENYEVKNQELKHQLLSQIANGNGDDFPFPFPGDDENGGGFPWPGNPEDGDSGGLPFPGNPGSGGTGKIQDNPAIPTVGSGGSGADALYSKQWGMNKNRVKDAWALKPAKKDIVVAVIDTGVDYTHEDLVDNMWRNPGETGKDSQGRDKSSNGIDDDGNGFIDDVVGWDFATNDNKPFDLTVPATDLLFGGGNPGHGTHVAGCVAARANNGKGVVGVADNHIKIMALRFLTEKGQGTTAGAIQAIRYAVDNGAQITNNSWGSEGEDQGDQTENQALRDAIAYAQSKGSLFIAAAGNGHNGVGYNNDTDSRPGYPASYDHDIIVSVAAIDSNDNLGSFSNWGQRSVDIAAPGVAVFSTMVGNKYNDLVIDLFGMKVTWDGTSMASPHVTGAAALYWSRNPEKSWQEVKQALMNSAERTSSLSGKVSSGGKLDTYSLISNQ